MLAPKQVAAHAGRQRSEQRDQLEEAGNESEKVLLKTEADQVEVEDE